MLVVRSEGSKYHAMSGKGKSEMREQQSKKLRGQRVSRARERNREEGDMVSRDMER